MRRFPFNLILNYDRCKDMIILAIETSCDDTCVSIIKTSGRKKLIFKILSNIVSSQVKIHRKYGGVYPTLAKREHQRNLPIILKRVLRKAGFAISNFQFPISKQIPNSKFQIPKIDLIAVTVGPGLEPCLWVGVNFAKDLSFKWNKPIIPVNHIEAHIFANFVGLNSKFKSQNSKPQLTSQNLFPAVCLVVSGGHTQLILMRNIGDYKILGETRDDAAGECFDKTARILGLGYPGGPIIAAEAAKYKIQNTRYKIQLPRPMMYTKDYDFSFSGLKTAVLYTYQKSKIKNQNYKREMCREIQQAVIDVLIKKTIKAAKDYKVKTIILGGGVSANKELRKQLQEKIKKEIPNTKYLIPDTKYCTDNAAMVGVAGYFNWLKNKSRNWKKIEVNANLKLK